MRTYMYNFIDNILIFQNFNYSIIYGCIIDIIVAYLRMYKSANLLVIPKIHYTIMYVLHICMCMIYIHQIRSIFCIHVCINLQTHILIIPKIHYYMYVCTAHTYVCARMYAIHQIRFICTHMHKHTILLIIIIKTKTVNMYGQNYTQNTKLMYIQYKCNTCQR